jgi:CBS domain-containing protein
MGLLRLAQATPEISPKATVQEAVRIMTEGHVGAIAVTEGRKIAGIFTERDLMRRVVYAGKDPAGTLVEEAMTSPVVTVSDSTSVGDATVIMRSRHIRHLAIVDGDGELVGMVALRYLLYDTMEELERKVDSLEGYMMADALGG